MVLPFAHGQARLAREASLLEWLLVFAPFPSLCSHLIRISGSSGLAEFPSPSFVSDKRQ